MRDGEGENFVITVEQVTMRNLECKIGGGNEILRSINV